MIQKDTRDKIEEIMRNPFVQDEDDFQESIDSILTIIEEEKEKAYSSGWDNGYRRGLKENDETF